MCNPPVWFHLPIGGLWQVFLCWNGIPFGQLWMEPPIRVRVRVRVPWPWERADVGQSLAGEVALAAGRASQMGQASALWRNFEKEKLQMRGQQARATWGSSDR